MQAPAKCAAAFFACVKRQYGRKRQPKRKVLAKGSAALWAVLSNAGERFAGCGIHTLCSFWLYEVMK
jgi:hypothetical protein